jgi:hypothetical protein
MPPSEQGESNRLRAPAANQDGALAPRLGRAASNSAAAGEPSEEGESGAQSARAQAAATRAPPRVPAC